MWDRRQLLSNHNRGDLEGGPQKRGKKKLGRRQLILGGEGSREKYFKLKGNGGKRNRMNFSADDTLNAQGIGGGSRANKVQRRIRFPERQKRGPGSCIKDEKYEN